MSRVEIYAIRENGDVEYYGDARNSFGGAYHIWVTLAEKYKIECKILEFGPLWKSIRSMSESDQWVLASTFDRVVIQKQYIPKLIQHLKEFCRTASTPTLEEELNILKRMVVDDSVHGVCFNQTSVNCGVWEGDYDPETEEYGRYNIHRHTNHWFLTPESYAATERITDIAGPSRLEQMQEQSEVLAAKQEEPMCHADRDGDCTWTACPQLRDNEPHTSGRHCPLDTWDDGY